MNKHKINFNTKKIISVLFVVVFSLLQLSITVFSNDNITFDMAFEDDVLKENIIKSSNGEITADTPIEEVVTYYGGINHADGTIGFHRKNDEESISSIKGVEYLIHLNILQLSNHNVKDLSPIQNLTKIFNLKLSNNKIDDKVLKTFNGVNMLALNDLNLENNDITDITPLGTIMESENRTAKFTSLRLNDNKIKNVSVLEKMKDLNQLFLDNNCIAEIPTGLYDIAQTARIGVYVEDQKITLDKTKFVGDVLSIENPIKMNGDYVSVSNISDKGVLSEDSSQITWTFDGNIPQNLSFDFEEIITENNLVGDSIFSGTVSVPIEQQQTYTVTYTDGVENEEVFPNQVHTVINGNPTPDFTGNTSRKGYTFTGWAPSLSPTVTDDVTYIAQWQRISAKVIVHHVDENENPIADDIVLDGFVNDDYSTDALEVDGYELIATPDNAIGKFIEDDVDVTYIYRKVEVPTEPTTKEPSTETPSTSTTEPHTDKPIEPTSGDITSSTTSPSVPSPSTGDVMNVALLSLVIFSTLGTALVLVHKRKQTDLS